MNIKKTKIVTIEEMHNCNTDNEDIKSVKYFAFLGSVINSNGDCCQEIKRRLPIWL